MNKRTNHLTLTIMATALTLAWGYCEKTTAAEAKTKTTAKGAAALDVSNQLAAIAAAGDPVTLEAVDKLYVTPPTDQNAAPLYEQAFAVIKNEDTKSATFVADNIQALPLLVKAAERKACRYPVVLTEGYSAKLPHLKKVKQAATLLQMVAVNQTAKRRPDAATITLLADLRLAHSLDNEPLIISKLVEIASLTLTLDGLAQSFSLQAFSDAQLQSLQASLKPSETGISFRQAMVCERACIISAFQMSDEEMAKAGKDLGGTNETLDLAAYRKTDKFQQDFAFALVYMSNMVALAEMPYPQSLETLPKNVAQIEAATAQGFIISKMLLPALGTSFGKSAKVTARMRAAQVALAVERYRLKHTNTLPGTLTDLVPEFIAAIPADPFDGQPLRFRPLPDKGYVIYSVGEDRKDDSGSEKASDGKTQLDVVFTVKR
jgi:hypothetical protein